MSELMKWNFATRFETYKSMAMIAGRVVKLSLRRREQRPAGQDQRKWWQKSGVCVPNWVPRSFCIPGRTVTIRENGAHGVIVVQGRGKFGALEIESPTMIRFGEMTGDELFAVYRPAREGIAVTNTGEFENLVMLKHFGPQA